MIPVALRSVLAALALGAMTCFAAPAAAQVVAYHDVSAASHQAQFTALTGQGYRLTQLSVAGGLSTQRYSAIWRQTTGPNWVASHGMSLGQYVNQRTTWIGQGYRPKYVTAAGTGADIVFAAVFVADGATVVDLLGNSESSFTTTCAQQRALGRWPVSVDIYNTSTSPWYTAVFEPNTTGEAWAYVIDASPSEFNDTFGAFYEADARIAALGMSESQRYVSVWRDDRLGPWAARSNYSSAGWQTQSTSLTSQGLSPTVIASGGSGASLRFAGSFSTDLTPRTRVLTKTGIVRPEFASFDTYMESFVQATKTRNAAIAISKDGRLVYARGYTWGESGTPITQPTSLFRIASLTKVLTSIAVHKLMQNGQQYQGAPLTLADKPKDILGMTAGNVNFANVTLLDCLEYTTGLQRNYSGRQAAQFANPSSPVLPATHMQAVNWLAVQTYEFPAGTKADYCNTGFLLAAQVVRHFSGQSLQGFLQGNLYTPLGITRSRVAASLSANLASGELKGQSPDMGLQLSSLHMPDTRKATQWSGDMGLADGSGGMASSAVDWARVMAGTFGLGADWIVLSPSRQGSMLARHSFPIGDEGPGDVTPGSFSWSQRANGVWVYNKSGDLSDAKARTFWRTDGVSVTVLANRGDALSDFDHLNDLVELVPAWPTDDLFPNYGLPTFPRRPAVASVSASNVPNVGNAPIVVTGERLDTATSVHFGLHTITDTTPANWHNGWFRVLSPTQLEFYPPQGLPSSWYGLSVWNGVGGSAATVIQVDMTAGPLVVAAPPSITTSQTFRIYCGSGALPELGVAMIGFSTSNVPSVAPGIVDLGIGNGFSNLVWTDARLFDAGTDSVFWTIPQLPWPDFHVQAIAYDLTAVNPWPLPSSNVRSIDVQ